MRNRELKVANMLLQTHESRGYLTRCRCCRRPIYIKRDWDGVWRPYESWAAGTVGEHEWVLHNCDRT